MVQWSLSLGLPPSLPDATIWYSMTPANSQPSTTARPRVGIPWRTSDEEDKARTAGPNWKPGRTEDYRKAVESAGGEAVFVPLKDQKERDRLIPTLDAFVLPGSSADIHPLQFPGKNTRQSAQADQPPTRATRPISH